MMIDSKIFCENIYARFYGILFSIFSKRKIILMKRKYEFTKHPLFFFFKLSKNLNVDRFRIDNIIVK